MDGNGRWAKRRNLPRTAGHKAGADALKNVVKACRDKDIKILTVWAFSTENWGRPKTEVSYLMKLMTNMIKEQMAGLCKNNVQFRVIGNKDQLAKELREVILESEKMTAKNTGLKFTVAINYGGRWDLTQGMKKLAQQVEKGALLAKKITEKHVASQLCLAELPEPDLLIRTGGEMRISNFFLWQLAYTELYFTKVFWPDFSAKELGKALAWYAKRERRFGLI